MKRVFAAILAIITLALASCGETESPSLPPSPSFELLSPAPSLSPSPEPSPEPVVSLDIAYMTGGGTGGGVTYPEIRSDSEGAALINEYIYERTRGGWGDGFSTYSEAFYNRNGIVSFLFWEVRFTVEVTGSSGTLADTEYVEPITFNYYTVTVDAGTGTRVTPDDIFTVSSEEYLPRLLGEENVSYFDAEHVYLCDEGVAFIFPQYTAELGEPVLWPWYDNVEVDTKWTRHIVPYSELSDILNDRVIYE